MLWTKKEIEVLENNANKPIDELMELLPGRSKQSIHVKKTRLFPQKRVLKQWSREDRFKLVDLVHKETPLAEIYEAFPSRTPSAIRSQISYLRQRQWNI